MDIDNSYNRTSPTLDNNSLLIIIITSIKYLFNAKLAKDPRGKSR